MQRAVIRRKWIYPDIKIIVLFTIHFHTVVLAIVAFEVKSNALVGVAGLGEIT